MNTQTVSEDIINFLKRLPKSKEGNFQVSIDLRKNVKYILEKILTKDNEVKLPENENLLHIKICESANLSLLLDHKNNVYDDCLFIEACLCDTSGNNSNIFYDDNIGYPQSGIITKEFEFNPQGILEIYEEVEYLKNYFCDEK